MNRDQHLMMEIVQKIPVFHGLSFEQARIMIQNSQFRQYGAGDTIYSVGEIANEMLVLIKGRLSVLSASRMPLGETLPGQWTGEMGVFTGHRRSATIVAAEDSSGLTISRDMLGSVMNNDIAMKCVILENVVEKLSDRLEAANTRVEVLSASLGITPHDRRTGSRISDEDYNVISCIEKPLEEEPGDEEAVDAGDDGDEEVAGEDDEMPEAEDLA